MLRHLTVVTLSLALLSPAIADTYKDPDGRFDVVQPDGWVAQKIDDRRVVTFAFAHEKSDAAPYDSICMGLFMEIPSTRSYSQKDLNEALESQLTPDFWQKAMSSTDPNFKMTLNSSGSREQDGRKIYNIVYTGTGTKNGVTQSAKGKSELHFVPGSMHFVMCMSLAEQFDAATAGFNPIFASYVPHPDTLVSRNEYSAPSVLTMYAAANFKGVARVLSTDVASLAAAGFPTATAAVTVDGSEPWQVCTGRDYSGACRTITVAESNPLTIGSARRIADTRNFAGVAATALRRALQTAAVRALVATH